MGQGSGDRGQIAFSMEPYPEAENCSLLRAGCLVCWPSEALIDTFKGTCAATECRQFRGFRPKLIETRGGVRQCRVRFGNRKDDQIRLNQGFPRSVPCAG